ncbi:hypothetical protein DU484_18780 (plasmid) [Haloplanus rubicundus]|uniref:Uncharacterized protein n=1 Tax=Haloplanus rubicundus TaxID=1547898 RepID=A0A345EID5_9EURY|nr:hypothetical protein DU484_18780 [Haloplanus rubicundus]
MTRIRGLAVLSLRFLLGCVGVSDCCWVVVSVGVDSDELLTVLEVGMGIGIDGVSLVRCRFTVQWAGFIRSGSDGLGRHRVGVRIELHRWKVTIVAPRAVGISFRELHTILARDFVVVLHSEERTGQRDVTVGCATRVVTSPPLLAVQTRLLEQRGHSFGVLARPEREVVSERHIGFRLAWIIGVI